MKSLTVNVKKADLSACMTCPLCNTLFRDATAISECLHTFCRECIYKKLTEEYLKHCPVCNADLGCAPLDKLRADNIMHDLREKIFPCEGENAKAPDNVPSVPLPTKRRSLSSLVSNTPKLSSHSSIFARRATVAARKVFAPQESTISTSKPDNVGDIKKDEKQCRIEILDQVSRNLSARKAKAVARKNAFSRESTLSCQPDRVTGDDKKDEDQSQLETFNETSKPRFQQNSSKPDLSQQRVPNKISEDNAELLKEKAHMREPLNGPADAASKTKSRNSTRQEKATIPVPVDSDNDSQPPNKDQVKTRCHRIKAAGDQNESTPSKSDNIKPRRLRSTQQRSAKISEDLNDAAESVIGSNSESNKESSPIWFSLIASQEKEVGPQLPQISSCYLRVKDDSLPVSFIKKYLVKKLDLVSEAEVEILLRGEPVLSSLQLRNLADFWLQTMPQCLRRFRSLENSAKNFVMILQYCRKAQSSQITLT